MNIIIDDRTMLFWSTICYRHRGWLTKNASKIVHPPMTFKTFSSPESKYTYVVVSPIYCCYGAAILAAERYVCIVALGAFISISGLSHSAQTDVHMICIKISSDITHLREHKLHTNSILPHIINDSQQQ